MVRYRYTPLPGNNYIRLATIHPGKFKDDIVVSFDPMPFPESEYEALSYVWGSKKNPLPVYVSRCDVGSTISLQKVCRVRFENILTTRNLVIALRHLRYVDKPRVMWIDALCINQADAIEKGPQVAMMGDIFRLAHRVVAWLGPEDNDSNHAMDLMHYLGSQVEVDYRRTTMSTVNGCADPSLGDRNSILQCDARGFRSIHHLISREWFERLWVRQEILLANSNAVVTCGFRQVRWTRFRRALYCITSKPKEISIEFNPRTKFIRGLILHPGYTSLLDIRSLYQTCQCLNPLDRLYAILAMLPQREREMISSPDYTVSYVDLYTDFARHWVSQIGRLDILGLCDLGRDDGPCPSWVPDWSKHSRLAHISNNKMTRQSTSSQLMGGHGFPQPGVLRITGISRTVKQHHQLPDLNRQTATGLFEEIPKLMLRLSPARQLTVEYYARLLTANVFGDDYEPPLKDIIHLNEAKQIVELMLSDYQFNDNDFEGGSTVGFKFLQAFVSSVGGLQLFQTTGGHLGIASESTRVGDETCCVLGCSASLLLRPLENGTFKLVGPCFVPDFANGEAFLGPLPQNFRPVTVYNDASGFFEHGFKDVFSGETTYEDPRLKSLPLDPGYLHSFREHLDKDHGTRIYVDPEILRENGVELRCFDLV